MAKTEEKVESTREFTAFLVTPAGGRACLKTVGVNAIQDGLEDVELLTSEGVGYKLEPALEKKTYPAKPAGGFRKGGGAPRRSGGGGGGGAPKDCPFHDGLRLFPNSNGTFSHKDRDSGEYCNGEGYPSDKEAF
jgi:hypothetical protein